MKTVKRCFALAVCLLLFFSMTAPAARAEGAPEQRRGYILTEIEPETELTEDEVPLASTPVQEHNCCMLHFFLLLLALALVIVYTVDSRNRQRWLFRLQQALEEE